MLLKEANIHLYCLFGESCFSDICTIIELKEINWLCKHMENVIGSQPCISMNFCTESSYSTWVSLIVKKFEKVNSSFFVGVYTNTSTAKAASIHLCLNICSRISFFFPGDTIWLWFSSFFKWNFFFVIFHHFFKFTWSFFKCPWKMLFKKWWKMIMYYRLGFDFFL